MISRDFDVLPIDAVIVLHTNDSSDAVLAKIKKTASVVSSYITNEMGTGAPSLAAVMTVSGGARISECCDHQSKAHGECGRESAERRTRGASLSSTEGFAYAARTMIAR